MIRNTQVPAYCPEVVGVHCIEKRGVVRELKKTMPISDASISPLLVELEADMSMLPSKSLFERSFPGLLLEDLQLLKAVVRLVFRDDEEKWSTVVAVVKVTRVQ